MRQRRYAAVLGLVMALGAANPLSVCAASAPEEYDVKTQARLLDQTLEYDEIPNLVTEYNPMYRMMKQGIALNTAPAVQGIDAMREQASEFNYLYKEEKEGGNPVLAKVYQDSAISLKKQADKAERSISSATRLNVNSTRKKLISTVQGLVIAYHQQQSAREMLEVAVELSQAAYETKKTQLSLGMATANEVLAAEKTQLDAQSNLQKLTDGITTLRQNLCMMTGWSYDAVPEIGPVPAPDLSRIDTMNPEQDIAKAISNQSDLIAERNTQAKGMAAVNQRSRTVEESEALLKTNLQTLYQEVLQGKADYEAASSAYQGAQITMNGAELKRQIGKFGSLEYLSAKMAFQQQKMTYEQASLRLFDAINTYEWALEGLAEIQ